MFKIKMCKWTSEERGSSSDFITVLEITECHFWYVLLAKAVRSQHQPHDGESHKVTA